MRRCLQRRLTTAVGVAMAMALLLTLTSSATAQGPCRAQRISNSAVRQHAREAEAAWNAAEESIRATRQHMATQLSRETVIAGPMKDDFGDPLYGNYGPRAYAHSPFYNGPAVTGSFEPPRGVALPDSEHRGYYRGAASVPGLSGAYGNATWPGATHSYLQAGMMAAPGSIAPSGARPGMLNH